MNETDDRLASDLVWELFAQPNGDPSGGMIPAQSLRNWLTVAALIGVGWLLYPPMAVVVACLAVAWRDFRTGRRIARTIPDKAGGKVCARFNYAWGAWKFGIVAVAMMFAFVAAFGPTSKAGTPPSGFVAAGILCIAGFTASSILAASGVWAAYRSGMRVWIGEGVNRSRTLLLGMLIVAFVYGVLLPTCFGLEGRFPRAQGAHVDLAGLLLFFGCWLVAPIAICLILDTIARRVIADTPGKFGPKVPAVGKWNAPPPRPNLGSHSSGF